MKIKSVLSLSLCMAMMLSVTVHAESRMLIKIPLFYTPTLWEYHFRIQRIHDQGNGSGQTIPYTDSPPFALTV